MLWEERLKQFILVFVASLSKPAELLLSEVTFTLPVTPQSSAG